MVYFVQLPTGSIKIGKADDVDQRRRTLTPRFGRPLIVLGVLPGGIETEREIHRRFAHLRFKGTEKFRPDADLMEFIRTSLMPFAPPKLVKLDRLVAAQARYLAELRGVSLAELLTEVVGPRVAEELAKELAAREPKRAK